MRDADSHSADLPRPRHPVTVIVGGVAGGMSAATRLRRLDEEREIIVLERSGAVSFANCGLPYYVSGVIGDRDDLLLQDPARLAARFRIDVRVRHRGDRHRPCREDRDGPPHAGGAEERLRYDELVLSPGAAPRLPERVATDAPLHALRTLDDLDAIMAALAALPAGAPAVVLGGGFIGMELADNLHRRGLATTLVQRGTRCCLGFDPEMASPLVDHVRGAGVTVELGRPVARVERDRVVLADDTVLPAALVIAAIGVVPETALARAAGSSSDPAAASRSTSSIARATPRSSPSATPPRSATSPTGEPRLVALAGPGQSPRAGRRRHDRRNAGTGSSRARHGDRRRARPALRLATGWTEKLALRPPPRRPRHPHAPALARRLLPRRADDVAQARRRRRRPT